MPSLSNPACPLGQGEFVESGYPSLSGNVGLRRIIVGHRLTPHRECPTQIRGLVAIVQAPVQNGTDTPLPRFYHNVQGKSTENFSYNWRVDMGTTRKPRKESNKAALARIKKEMAQPRIAKSARNGASTRKDSQ